MLVLVMMCLNYMHSDLLQPSQLLCGQAVVTGFAWMAQLKRCSRSQSREPEPRPTPTLGTAPTPLPLLLRRAVKRAGCTSTIPPESISVWTVRNIFVCPAQTRLKMVPSSATSVSVSEPQVFSGKS